MALPVSRGLIYCACIAGWATASPAFPETDIFFKRDHNYGVTERPRADYTSDPIRFGPFSLRPTLQIDPRYDDNIYANDSDKQRDFITGISASAELKAQWSRHTLSANSYVLHNRHIFHSDETTTDFGVSGGGGMDINRNISIAGGGYARWMHEPRRSANSDTALLSPISYHLLGGYTRQTMDFQRLQISTNIEYEHLDYQNGTLKNNQTSQQDRRDRHRGEILLRGDYEISPDTSLFVRTGWKGIYFIHPDQESNRSNSNDFRVDTGINMDLSNLIRGQLSISYISRFFEEADLKTLHGIGFEANLDWFMTPRLTFWLGGERRFVLSGLSKSPALLETSARLGMDYELQPNIILSGHANYSDFSFVGIKRDDTVISGEMAINWLINRYMILSLNYLPTWQTSSGQDAGRKYTKHTVFLALQISH